MGSIFSREGSKDNLIRGGEEEKEEEKTVFRFAYQPPRPDRDFLFAAHRTTVDNKNGNRLSIRSVQEEEKEKEKKGIVILFIFILAREVILKVIQRKREENTESSNFSSLCDELQLRIMSKVPIHSLVKLRRVSKTWRSWISKEHFSIGKCPPRTDGIFFVEKDGFPYNRLPTNDNYDKDEDSYTIYYPPPTSSFPFPTIIDDYVSRSSVKFKGCLSSCNGLLLLSNY